MDPKSQSVEFFNYQLPQDKIANFPLEERDQSKLLIFKNKTITDSVYYNIDEFLSQQSLIVFNRTRVVQARLHFKTITGATIEIFCLEPENKKTEVNQAMQQSGRSRWKCLVGELRKWKEDIISLSIPDDNKNITLSAKLVSKQSDAFLIEFSWQPIDLTMAEVLEMAGKIPLPPYIKREISEEDKERYQTIYAKHDGSVAAPTAGLHYTERIFEKLQTKNINVAYLTLHIGAGTFKPVKSATIADHEMHSEQIVVERNFIQNLLSAINGDIVAVGTTSLRTIESLYWIGLKIKAGLFDATKEIAVEQWDPYILKASISAKDALTSILDYLDANQQVELLTRTQIMIVPGYEWKIVNVLATNFHQPKSTLIMLIAAFIGEDWKKIYDHALSTGYRFLSYGDGSLLFRNK